MVSAGESVSLLVACFYEKNRASDSNDHTKCATRLVANLLRVVRDASYQGAGGMGDFVEWAVIPRRSRGYSQSAGFEPSVQHTYELPFFSFYTVMTLTTSKGREDAMNGRVRNMARDDNSYASL